MSINYFTNAVNIAKDICRKKINKGDTVVDATMGNGHDTVFLGELVGDDGKVYAFDIQDEAVNNTKKALQEHDLEKRVILIKDGHENMDSHIYEEVKLVIFNLGYLPRAEHCITTKAETTVEAIKKAMKLITSGGIILVILYPGHPEGSVEVRQVKKLASSINQKEYSAAEISFINQINNPPFLIAIEKRQRLGSSGLNGCCQD